MLVIFEVFDIAAFKPLLLGIPESLGLLIFGVGLVVIAMALRWVLGRHADGKVDKELGEKI